MITFTDALVLPVSADPAAPAWFHGWVHVDDGGLIAGLGPDDPPPGLPGDVHDLGGAILAPGFVSAHSHLFTAGMRGIAPDDTLYGWVSRMGEMMVGAEAEDLYWFTLAGCLDFLRNGVTSAYNFTQSRVVAVFDHSSSTLKAERVHDVDFLTRQIDAQADSGLRCITSTRLDDEQLPEDECFEAFAHVSDHRLRTVPRELDLGGSVFGSVQWSSSPVTAERERHAMATHGVGNQAHFVETAEHLEVQRAKFDWYDRAGVLGPDFAFGHFVHPTDHMVDRVAETGSAVIWQATSNGRLGSGIADITRYRDAGIRVGMGLDDQSCTDVSDPFQNMRIGLYTQRALHSDAAVLAAREVLRMHTLGAAEALGLSGRIGSVEVGKHADLVVVDPTRPATGPIWNPVATYVLACSLRNLTHVYVGGRLVAEGARNLHPLADEADAQLTDRMIRSARVRGFTPAFARASESGLVRS